MTDTNDRYRDKVRKLLALAESSNPHEAERALAQAKKIMAKYNISARDSEIVQVRTGFINRKRLKDYESLLLGCIQSVSGCESFIQGSWHNGKWRCCIEFVGVTSDANMAAYCFDVLYTQLKRYDKTLREEYGLNAAKRDIAANYWVKSAGRKLFDFFERKEPPEHVSDFYERSSEGIDFAEVRETKETEDEELNLVLKSHGARHGSEARLNKATTHQGREALE